MLFLSHAHIGEEKLPLITRESIEALKKTASFQVIEYENHPFKELSQTQLKYKLGLMSPVGKSQKEVFYGAIRDDLPTSFDSRTQWPSCIHAIRDQEQCGSCWAFAASEVLSDRFCIASKSKTDVILSPQELVSCDTQDYGCQGGYVDKSWDYIRDTGIVADSCLPYTSGDGDSGSCPFNSNNKCQDGSPFKRYQVTEHGQRTTIEDAKTDIVANGPLEAAFDVYDDFMSYQGGVYKRTSDNLLGGHAVKIVGWGVDTDGTEYWIVANSWNTSWGEDGFFRIAFGECNFEQSLWAGTPSLNNSLMFLSFNH